MDIDTHDQNPFKIPVDLDTHDQNPFKIPVDLDTPDPISIQDPDGY